MDGCALSVKAVFSGGMGTAARLLGDIERFGFDLLDFRFSQTIDGNGVVRFVVSAENTDRVQVRARFARHPNVSSVRVVERKARADRRASRVFASPYAVREAL